MSNFGNYYDTSAVEANTGFDKLPDGEYEAIAVESELKDNKKGNGKYIQFKFSITNGKFKDRTIFGRFNIQHENEDAQNIGRSQLKAFCEAVKKPNASDGEELLRIPVFLVIGTQKGNSEYNEIKKIKPYGNSVAENKGEETSKPSWSK